MALQSKTYSSSTTSNEYTLKLTITENSTSTANNTSNITYKLYMTSGGWNFDQYAVGWEIKLNNKVVSTMDRYDAPQISLGYNSSVIIVQGTTNVKHNSDGTLNMSISGKSFMAKDSYTPGDMSLSGSMRLTGITPPAPDKSSILGTLSNFDLESEFRFPFTSYSSDYYHKLILKVGSTTVKTVNSYLNNQSIRFTPEEILNAYQLMSSSTGTTVSVTLETYNDNDALVSPVSTKSCVATWIGTSQINVSGTYRRARPWVNINGTWKPCVAFYNIDGSYWRGE